MYSISNLLIQLLALPSALTVDLFKVCLWEAYDSSQAEHIEVLQENKFEPEVQESEQNQDITVYLLEIFKEFFGQTTEL